MNPGRDVSLDGGKALGDTRGVRTSSAGRLAALVLVLLGSGRGYLWAESPWPRETSAELSVTAAPFAPALSAVRLSLPASRISEAEWLERFDVFAWYLADSAWLYPVSYLEVGAGVRMALIEGPRLLVASGIGVALAVQTLGGTLSVPLLLDGEARYALSPRVCLDADKSQPVTGGTVDDEYDWTDFNEWDRFVTDAWDMLKRYRYAMQERAGTPP